MHPYLELKARAELSSVRVLNDLLDVALRYLQIDDACRHDLAIGVAELIANICKHEYRAEDGEVLVRLDMAPSELVLTVISQGPPFDFEAALRAPVVDDDDPLAALGGSGLGLPLVVGLFDSVDHAYEEARNRITLRKNRAG